MLEAVLRQAERDSGVQLARLQRYIQQPSIAAENRGIDETVAMVAKEIDELGGVGRVVPAKEFPIVFGRFDVGAKRTLLVHSMYDTTPADEPNWSVPPFSVTPPAAAPRAASEFTFSVPRVIVVPAE